MASYCKFCSKPITTDHYVIYKGGSVCLECKEKVRNMLRGIVDIQKGEKNESDSGGGIRSNCSFDNNGVGQKEVS